MLATLLLFMLIAPSDTGPASWTFSAMAMPDGQVELTLEARLEKGWYMYATELPSDDGPIATTFTFQPSEAYEVGGAFREPVPVETYDPNFAMTVRYHSDTVRFVLPVKPQSDGAFVVEGEVEYMTCTDRTCLPPRVVPFRFEIPARDAKQ